KGIDVPSPMSQRRKGIGSRTTAQIKHPPGRVRKLSQQGQSFEIMERPVIEKVSPQHLFRGKVIAFGKSLLHVDDCLDDTSKFARLQGICGSCLFVKTTPDIDEQRNNFL